MMEVQDLERIVNLLKGQLDPDLTKFDTISATTEEVDPVRTDSLNLHPGIQDLLEDRFETLLPVQSLAVENSLLDGEDQLVVSATATGKTLVGEMTGIDRVLEGKGTMLFLVPLVALANQKYGTFRTNTATSSTSPSAWARAGSPTTATSSIRTPMSSSAPTRGSTTPCGRARRWETSGPSSSTRSTR